MDFKTLDFKTLKQTGHELVVFCNNPECGLQAIIAIHNTALGPAFGGTRMFPYPNESAALEDVLRLSKGMTYKCAATGLNYGGGKGVILGDPKQGKSESLFRAYGTFVERLKGQFITGEDLGLDVNDVEFMYMETDYVVGLSKQHGGSGDPGFMTAYGLIQGLQACVEQKWGNKRGPERGRSPLEGLTVAVQGLGHVGLNLVEMLIKEKAKVIACDADSNTAKEAQKKFAIEMVSPEEIYSVHCDIFSPCAVGGILNRQTIPQLKCTIIAGSANNQLKEGTEDKLCVERGILYAPDYVINAGGLINVSLELEGYSETRAKSLCRNIYYHLRRVFEIADQTKITPQKAADQLVEERIKNVTQINRSHFLDKSRIRRG